MSLVLEAFQLNPLEMRLIEDIKIPKPLIPFASSIDLLCMRVHDLTSKLSSAKKPLNEIAKRVELLFMQIQFHVEIYASFATSLVLIQSPPTKILESLKQFRIILKPFSEDKSSLSAEASLLLAKTIFFAEQRLNLSPIIHLIQPFQMGKKEILPVYESEFFSYLAYFQRWAAHVFKDIRYVSHHVNDFISHEFFFVADSLVPKRKECETYIRQFLWNIQVERMRISQDFDVLSPEDAANRQKACRCLYLSFVKSMRLLACFDKMVSGASAEIDATKRMKIDLKAKSKAMQYINSLEKLSHAICKQIADLKANASYPVYFSRLEKALNKQLGLMNVPSLHTDFLLIDYFRKTIEPWTEETPSLELYYEGFYFDQEVISCDVAKNSQEIADAFHALYEQTVSSLPTHIKGKEMQVMLEKFLPYLKVWSCMYSSIKDVLLSLVHDELNPKTVITDLEIGELFLIKAQQFMHLELLDLSPEHDVEEFEPWLQSVLLKAAFQSVLSRI
jgi:hypothetical protein